MPKPRNLKWNSTAQRWESVGRDGLVKVFIDETGLGIGGNPAIGYFRKFVGSNAALASVVAYGGAVAIGTITNATGLAVGDFVRGIRKNTNLQTVPLSVGFYVPTTDTLNIQVGNFGTIAGSLPAGGWDIVAIR